MALKRLVAVSALAFAAAPASPAAPDPAATIATRQAAFRLSGAVTGSIKGAIDRGDDVAGQAGAANALAAWGRALPGTFPPGTDAPPSHALPTVWSERAGFEKAAADYADAAAKLGIAAKANDKAAFATQFAALRDTCSACHDRYRQPEQRH